MGPPFNSTSRRAKSGKYINVPIAMVKSKFHKDGKDGKLVRSLGVIIPKAIPPIPQRLGLDIDAHHSKSWCGYTSF